MSEQKTALIIEDEKSLLEAVRIKLEQIGFKVAIARSVEQALHELKKLKTVDVVWLDHYLLGRESGLDFVTRLKTEREWKSIPIFLVSNTASKDKVQAYMRLGVTKYYVKAEHRLDVVIEDIKNYLDNPEEVTPPA